MTVAELIEELRKHPQHHTVMLATFEPNLDQGSVEEVWSFVSKIAPENVGGGTGPIVRIIAEDA